MNLIRLCIFCVRKGFMSFTKPRTSIGASRIRNCFGRTGSAFLKSSASAIDTAIDMWRGRTPSQL